MRFLQGLRGIFADRMLRQACTISCCNRICWRLRRTEWQQCAITETHRYTSDGKHTEISRRMGVFWNLNGPWHKTLCNCHLQGLIIFAGCVWNLERGEERRGKEKGLSLWNTPYAPGTKGFACIVGSKSWSGKAVRGVWSLFTDGKTKS